VRARAPFEGPEKPGFGGARRFGAVRRERRRAGAPASGRRRASQRVCKRAAKRIDRRHLGATHTQREREGGGAKACPHTHKVIHFFSWKT